MYLPVVSILNIQPSVQYFMSLLVLHLLYLPSTSNTFSLPSNPSLHLLRTILFIYHLLSSTSTSYFSFFSPSSSALILSSMGGCERCQAEYRESYTGKPRLSSFNLTRAEVNCSEWPKLFAKASAWNSLWRLNIVRQNWSNCKSSNR